MNQAEFQSRLLIHLSDMLALTPDIQPGNVMEFTDEMTDEFQDTLLVATLSLIGHTNN